MDGSPTGPSENDLVFVTGHPGTTNRLETIAKLKQVVAAMEGAEIVQSDTDYLYAQYTTRLMKYVDDVEFWYDPTASVIQVRSASRVGRGDMGVNRARIEAVRAALATAP